MYLTLFTGHFSTHLASSGHHFKVLLYNCNEGMCFPSPPCLVFFLKNGHSRPLFFYFRLFNTQLTVNKCLNICQWQGSNHGPLVSEATTLPTEPQPLPMPSVKLCNLTLLLVTKKQTLEAGFQYSFKLNWVKI